MGKLKLIKSKFWKGRRQNSSSRKQMAPISSKTKVSQSMASKTKAPKSKVSRAMSSKTKAAHTTAAQQPMLKDSEGVTRLIKTLRGAADVQTLREAVKTLREAADEGQDTDASPGKQHKNLPFQSSPQTEEKAAAQPEAYHPSYGKFQLNLERRRKFLDLCKGSPQMEENVPD